MCRGRAVGKWHNISVRISVFSGAGCSELPDGYGQSFADISVGWWSDAAVSAVDAYGRSQCDARYALCDFCDMQFFDGGGLLSDDGFKSRNLAVICRIGCFMQSWQYRTVM